MAYTGTPVVRNDRLALPDGQERICVGTEGWFRWLQTATHFSYRLPQSAYSLTLRKEKRRQHDYWYAYLKDDSKLHNAYVGRSHTLTAAHLAAVTQRLLAKVRQAQLATQSQGGA